MKKKIAALCLVVSLLAIAVVGGTMAYFTETEQASNEFAIGNVAIDLYETVKQDDGAGKVTLDEEKVGYESDEATGIRYTNVMPGTVMTKVVTVENTGDNDAYIALTVKQENYDVFNDHIDGYYEKQPFSYDAAQMQEVTDAIFSGSGWDLEYAKNTLTPNNPVRYMMIDPAYTASEGVQELGYGYTNISSTDGRKCNYAGAYFENVLSQTGDVDGNFDSLPGDYTRMWIIYLMVPAGGSYTVDLTTTCPTFIDSTSIQAFKTELDVKAFAIQTSGFTADEAGQKAAFAELFKAGFAY